MMPVTCIHDRTVYNYETGTMVCQNCTRFFNKKETQEYWEAKRLAQASKQSQCYHVWETYTGFTDIFRYCSKCDMKEEPKK